MKVNKTVGNLQVASNKGWNKHNTHYSLPRINEAEKLATNCKMCVTKQVFTHNYYLKNNLSKFRLSTLLQKMICLNKKVSS